MRIDDDCVGALNVHGINPLHLDDDEVATAMVLCDVASAYVLNARLLAESRNLSQQLQGALSSRIVIEQAKGVLAERLGVGVDEAFSVLRGYARKRGTKLRTVAAGVLAGDIDLPATGRR